MINELLTQQPPYTGVLKDPELEDLKVAVGGGEEPGKNRPRLRT